MTNKPEVSEGWENLVDAIDDIMAKYHMGEHMYSPEREEIVAKLSHTIDSAIREERARIGTALNDIISIKQPKERFMLGARLDRVFAFTKALLTHDEV